jgi:hypothetical protein
MATPANLAVLFELISGLAESEAFAIARNCAGLKRSRLS